MKVIFSKRTIPFYSGVLGLVFNISYDEMYTRRKSKFKRMLFSGEKHIEIVSG